MTAILGYGCECPTTCDINISETGDGNFDQTYDLVTGGAAVGAGGGTLHVDFNDGGIPDSIDVYVGGVHKFYSCGDAVTDIDLSATDSNVRVVITNRCGSAGDNTVWLFDLTCGGEEIC